MVVLFTTFSVFFRRQHDIDSVIDREMRERETTPVLIRKTRTIEEANQIAVQVHTVLTTTSLLEDTSFRFDPRKKTGNYPRSSSL